MYNNDAFETVKNHEHYAVLGGGVRVPLEDVLKVSAASFNIATSRHKFANPAALGFCCWFLGCFATGIFLLEPAGVPLMDLVGCFALLLTGVGSFIVGNWEIVCENAFGSVAMSTFGMYWMSYGAIYIPTFGIRDAYADAPEQFIDALGLFFIVWAIPFVLLTWCTIRSTVPFFSMFLTFTIAVILQAAGQFARSTGCNKAAGIFHLISSVISIACGYGAMATPETTYFRGKTIPMPFAIKGNGDP